MKKNLIYFGLFFISLSSVAMSCKKDKAQSNEVSPLPIVSLAKELVGSWDKKDTVRVSFTADGSFTAQRWVAADNSYANNFALKGKYTISNDIATLNVETTNLAHLWSNQNISKITLTVKLSENKRSIVINNVEVWPTDLDVKALVLARLSNAFVKNDNPTIAFPVQQLSFETVSTYQPATPPTIKPWNYTAGSFNFTLSNYTQGIATPDENTIGLPTSSGGQHVHLIVDDAPYIAVGTTSFSNALANGEHSIVAAAGRSYHEVYKNPEAIVMSKITVSNGTEVNRTAITTPEIFANRPAGNYPIASSDKILIDYLMTEVVKSNFGITKKYVVRITVDQTPYLSTEWSPYVLKNLNTAGTHKISLQLYDRETKTIVKTITREFAIQ